MTRKLAPLIVLAFAILGPAGALGATITVETTKDEHRTGGKCSLREAIEAANPDTR